MGVAKLKIEKGELKMAASPISNPLNVSASPATTHEKNSPVPADARGDPPRRQPTRIRDIPTEMRPREELKRRGAAAMDLEKLLAIVMRSGQPGQNVADLARQLVLRAGGLEPLSHMTYLDILGLKLPGIGEVKAMELEAAFEIGRRAAASAASAVPRMIRTPEAVFEIMEPLVRGSQQEFFYILLLDARSRLVGQPVRVVSGTHDRCPANPAEIFSIVVKRGCTAAILVHNHPSGDPTPSQNDINVTIRLIDAANVLGVRLLDHIVVGRRTDAHPSGFTSLASERLVAFR
jgi:DNA repair protein RadC